MKRSNQRKDDGANPAGAATVAGRGDTLTERLHRELKAEILSGRRIGGTRLPSTRQFGVQAGVSRNIVLAVYDLLLSEGLVVSRRGAGTFVRDGAARPSQPPPAFDPRVLQARIRSPWRDGGLTDPIAASAPFDFRIGIPDTRRFPHDVWRRSIARAARELARRGGNLGPSDGLAPLRAAIARHVSFARAVACTADDIIVTAGAQQALDLIARVLVTPNRTVAAVEDPGYPPAAHVLAAAGARLHPVAVDAQGLVVDALPRAATLIYTTPSHQFPLGAVLSAQRRAALIAFAHARGAVIIEDDYDGEFRHHGRPLDALQTLDRAGQVIYVGTFSKSLFPALRLGFIVAPPWLRRALVAAKQLADWQCPLLEQIALAHFIDDGHLARHVRRMRRIYAERHDALTAAIQRDLGKALTLIPSSSGLHLAALTAPGKSAAALATRARNAGIAIQTARAYRRDHGGGDGLVFGIGQIETDAIDTAIRRLARLLTP
ncbi:MocR-like pyridoxine biosynthesis transcription factor PdxR [Bradyrhizobium sp. 2TAF24]|uniref:MocR-like pyridoxine biosynthesis transcription factor PdxR n=1 Tax=Bradyrhizobium sp. 2TAF24 TaxID=3233011 RepID=UPI003F9255E9